VEIPALRPADEIRGGAHLEWLTAAAAGGQPVDTAELLQHIAAKPEPSSIAMAHTIYLMIKPQVGEFTVRGCYEFESGAGVVVDGERGSWNLIFFLDAEDGRIVGGTPTNLPQDVSLRAVTEADADVLAEINRQSPIVMGDETTVYDTDDLFAAERLMGTSRAFIAEHDGAAIGLAAGVGVPMRIGNETGLFNYIHRTRVAPSGRGLGVQGALVWATLASTPPGFVGGFAVVHRSNDGMLRLDPPALVMPSEPERLSFNMRALAERAGNLEGGAASASDAARIVELINGPHDSEQLFLPYTETSLTERVSRDPSLYGWEHLRLSDRAVVGIWSNAYRVHRTSDGATSEDQRALMLDFGFESGAEGDFMALLAQTCAELAERGDTELTMLTSPGAPAYELLRPLASRVDGYAMLAGGMMLAGLEPGPAYLDQLYF
jgi:hypothetical protein